MSKQCFFECKICGNSHNNLLHAAKEMMFGFRDVFEYVECSQCKCVQIKEFPKNIHKYYPESYWEVAQNEKNRDIVHPILRWLNKEKTKGQLGDFSIVGTVLSSRSEISSAPVFSGWNWIKYFKKMGITTQSSILDVGCGAGDLLAFLWNKGFSDLHGLEPNANYSNIEAKWRIYKEISDLNNKYDLIMLHHSFEHMKDPLAVLKGLSGLINPKSYVVIRIPIASGAWERYATNWVQLDPPRHFFLHTLKSMEILVNDSGFKIVDIEFDSTDFQFWASEQYVRDIPLKAPNSYCVNKSDSIFSDQEIDEFKELSKKLNGNKTGDQACFVLKKA